MERGGVPENGAHGVYIVHDKGELEKWGGSGQSGVDASLSAPSSGHCIPEAVIQRNRLDLRAAAMQLAFSRHSIKY